MVVPTASLIELIAALEARAVSARELLSLYLDRVERLDPAINSVITVEAERAMTEAARIDEARAAGQEVGGLAGVPITIKDALATEGIRSTGGATELQDFVPDTDATVVATVRDEGAIVFGKTNVPRWSADYQSYNEMFGATNNPWDTTKTPGGSSGGPAAAVAMGLTGFEIGTDIGGSIRVPSAFCGVYGHKPTFGIIPTFGYLDSVRYHRHTADVNVFGPIARSIDDLDLLVDILAGPNPDDAVAWRLELPPPRAIELGEFRVAAWLDDPFAPVDPSVREVLEQAVAALDAAGARIDHQVRPNFDSRQASVDGGMLISSAGAISESDDRAHIEAGGALGMPHHLWDVLNRQRGETRQRWAEFFTDVDVLLCPVSSATAFAHIQSPDGPNWSNDVLTDYNDMPYHQLLRWNILIGSAYLPVTTPPVGRTAAGLPVGIQVVAPHLHDRTALTFARRITEVLGGYQPPAAALA